ncbi:M20 family metallopeptidase [Trichococcus collinsii]|uniref:Glutamate carboxypeptidase n=1 Tax=Trichococcus collinsii TaxID=157076 RepID=A0AB38A0F0_9LACT|nr:M20 family metallopeptidase [Trichococcus collinsii]CZR07225.1 peptidase m20 [Trichococcus collinsii]SEA28339.1 glutamate carboxypeptidase [Trichococcus collinsii]
MDFDRNQYLRELETIVNIDSGSRNPAGTREVAAFLEEKYRQQGFLTELVSVGPEVGPVLVATNAPDEPIDLLFIGHTDTVFLDGEASRRPFTIEGERLYGPGVYDMKGCSLLTAYLLENLPEELKQDLNICVIHNPDEEISSFYSREVIIEKAKTAKFAFVMEPSSADGSMIKERKGIEKLKIHFKGRPSHAGDAPQEGRSAINELAHWIVRMNTLIDYAAGVSVNAGTIQGGSVPNVVPEHAQMELDYRYSNPADVAAFFDMLEELQAHATAMEIGIDIEVIGKRPPMVDVPGAKELRSVFEDVGKQMDMVVSFKKSGGVSDANFTTSVGVPTVCSIGLIGGAFHTDHEYVELDSILQRLDLLTAVIAEMSRRKMFCESADRLSIS